MTSRRSLALALGITSVLGLAGSGCDATGTSICGSSDFDAEAGVVGDFGSSEPAAHVEAFLHATASLVIEVASIETRLTAACKAMAIDLGAPADELAVTNVAVACQRAALEIRTTIETNLPTNATLSLTATPAVCGVDVDAYASCVAECDVNVNADVQVECTGGELYGECSGTCNGSCNGTCSAGCQGSCGATCTGTCTGTCFGTCNGTCSARNAAGECVGECSGSCTGTCAGACMGSCSGTCSGGCMGSCEGECHGACSVMFTEPRCDGTVAVEASAECKSACDADVSFNVSCSRPEVTFELVADVTPAQRAKIDVLFATLEAHMPDVLEIQVAGSARLKTAADAFVVSLKGAGAAIDAGARAASCTLDAISAAIAASARIDVNVQATIDVSGSISAQGMAGAP